MLEDNSISYPLLSFLDTYYGYNQIPMYEPDRIKTTFMTEKANYHYNFMPFGLNNVGTTYQRMMNKIFQEEIGKILKVCMDDMIMKFI